MAKISGIQELELVVNYVYPSLAIHPGRVSSYLAISMVCRWPYMTRKRNFLLCRTHVVQLGVPKGSYSVRDVKHGRVMRLARSFAVFSRLLLFEPACGRDRR